MFLTIANTLLLCAGIITTLYTMYFAVIVIKGSINKKHCYPQSAPQARFALILPAKNEAAVIGPLIESLKRQKYPEGLYDIFVAPNNCTDNTIEVAKQCGAEIFNASGTIHSKGEVLQQMIEVFIESNQFDAICVFDADNIVHQDFLQRMNNAYVAGANVAQGFKDSKNPCDCVISTWHSIFYWSVGHLYNRCRENVGLSALLTGSGFMVTIAFLRKLDGWNTKTVTEDYEFSALSILANECVHYVADAIVYDEQPLTFGQSWKQRRRWSTGTFDCSRLYFADLMREAVKQRNPIFFDAALTYMNPYIFIIILHRKNRINSIQSTFLLHMGLKNPKKTFDPCDRCFKRTY